MGAEPDIMEFVEQMGGYFESRSLTRLAGRLLGWLLVCDKLQPASGNAAAASARAKVANREWVARSARNGFSTTSADPLQSVYHS